MNSLHTSNLIKLPLLSQELTHPTAFLIAWFHSKSEIKSREHTKIPFILIFLCSKMYSETVEHHKWQTDQQKIYRYTLSATGVSNETLFNFGWSENGSRRAYGCIWIQLQLGEKLLFQSLSKRHRSREWKWKRIKAISSPRESKQRVNIPQLTRPASKNGQVSRR